MFLNIEVRYESSPTLLGQKARIGVDIGSGMTVWPRTIYRDRGFQSISQPAQLGLWALFYIPRETLKKVVFQRECMGYHWEQSKGFHPILEDETGPSRETRQRE